MSENKPPVWVTVVAIVTALPLMLFPSFLEKTSGGEYSVLIKLYPLYVVGGCWLARVCWMQQRRELFWILIVSVWLGHGCVWWLAVH